MSFFTGSDRTSVEETAAQDDPLKPLPDDTADDADESAEATTRPRRRVVAARVTTGLACLLVLFALMGPNNLVNAANPVAYLRIPLEALLGVPLVLFLPTWPRRVAVVLGGISLGVLAVVKVADIGFFEVLDRPANLVFDWYFLAAGIDFLSSTIGRVGTDVAVAVIVVLAVATIVFMTLAVLRLARLVRGHRTPALRATGVLAVAWVACAVLGVDAVPGVPVAAQAYGRLAQVPRSLKDRAAFAKQAAVDPYRDVPAGRLLSGLRGKDVILTFVESYGRTAVDGKDYAATIDPILDSGTSQLQAAGFGARSAWLMSPTYGAGSWLAHSTMQSGLWVDNQQRYETLIRSNRLTLSSAFKRAGWRTVAVMPGTEGQWTSEGTFYGFDKLYDHWNMGYKGPGFNWHMPPDQYTLSTFWRDELAAPGHPPVMAEMPLVSSHGPWAPTPKMIPWNQVGDGTAYAGIPQSEHGPGWTWSRPNRIKAAYRASIAYSLTALISWVRDYGTANTVLVFLGDHQAGRVATGDHANHEVPVVIVAHDPAVLNQISGWGWQNGLRPTATAPLWRMDSFRNHFLAAFTDK